MCYANQLLMAERFRKITSPVRTCVDPVASSCFPPESYGRTDLHEKFVSLHGCPTIHQWYMNESPVPRTFIYAAIKYLNIIRDNNRGLVARLCKVIFTAIRARTEAPLANNDKAKLPVAVAVADAAMPCRLGVNGNTKQLYVNSSRKYSYADTR